MFNRKKDSVEETEQVKVEPDTGSQVAAENTFDQEAFDKKLSEFAQALKFSKNIKKSMAELEDGLLELLGASMYTIYQTIDNGKELKASFMGGANKTSPDIEIRVPFSPISLAGFVGLTQQAIVVEDVYDAEALIDIHPRLQWDKSYSEAKGLSFKSMVVVPIKDEILMGVIQLINQEGDKVFTREDLKRATLVAKMLATHFRSEFQSTQGPYDFLVYQKKISSEDLDEVKKNADLYGGSVSKMLMDDFDIEADEIGKSLEFFYRVPYMRYDSNITLPMELMENIGASYLRNNLWVPIAGNKEEVTILIDDPSDYQRIMEVQGIINARNYVFRVGLSEHILQYLNAGGEDEEGDGSGFEDVFKNLQEETGVEFKSDDETEEEDTVASSAIIQLVNKIIVESDRMNASDIHIEPGRDKTAGLVRVRVDGICRELLKIPGEHVGAIIARIKVISRLDIAERRLPQDGKCKLKIRGRALELRVATVPTVNGESAVLRLLAAGNALPVEKLNLNERNLNNLLELAKNPHGLILVVGPTGSGKTTTLHAVLGHINEVDRKIWTAEDPVEITQPGLQQVQMQPKIGFTFAAAMRSFLRADPDVILIGEMRDHETASIAVEASLTGHLVLSTLHTNSAPETITRLLDLGLDPINFSDALLGVLAQRLMRTLCKECKEAYTPDEKELNHLIDQYGREQFAETGIQTHNAKLHRAVGCDVCSDTGYLGRTGVFELLMGTRQLQNLIYNKAELEVIRQQAINDGMRTLKQDAIEKIFMGLSDHEQLLRIISE